MVAFDKQERALLFEKQAKELAALVEARKVSTVSDDEWTWESLTISVEEEEEEPLPEVKKKKKGKDKKKGKGKKKKKEEEKETVPVEVAAPPPVDIMAEIAKMKELAEQQAQEKFQPDVVSLAPTVKSRKSVKSVKRVKGEGEGKKEKKEPKPPKVKLSKAQKRKLELQMAEQKKKDAEAEAKRQAEEEKHRLEEERKAAIAKQNREVQEQQLRMEQLTASSSLLKEIVVYNAQIDQQFKTDREWEHYLKCDGLPAASDCPQMNTYIHLWEKEIDDITLETAIKKTGEVLKLLSVLNEIIDDPVGEEEWRIQNWREIRQAFREHQQLNLDGVTYRLMRNVYKNLNLLNLYVADYNTKQEHFALCIWCLVLMPKPKKPRSKKLDPFIDIDFEETQMYVRLPLDIDCYGMFVRSMCLQYDHLSDTCSTYQPPEVPQLFRQDLYATISKEWNEKLWYKYVNRTLKEDEPLVEEAVDREKGIIPVVKYKKLEPSASMHVINIEDIIYHNIRQKLLTKVNLATVNLRKYMVLGGVYYINLYYQPPQPKQFVSFDMCITRLKQPKWLFEVPFVEDYQPPPPPEPGIIREPEEIEEELKKQEQELDKLIFIKIILPTHVMWLDVPIVCQWDAERKEWTTENIHDMKHIEDKGYINLPYQTWEMKPEEDGSVTLQITAAILTVEFNVKAGLVAITQIQNSPNDALEGMIGQYLKLPTIIRRMRRAGVDIFPNFDAFCYIEGTCEKNWPMEQHLYYGMAEVGVCFNFTWSRWNLLAGRRRIVMQMREYFPDKPKQKPYSMLLVTPLNALYIDCTEVSQVLNEEGVDGMLFYSDLYHLVKGSTGMATKSKIQNVSYQLVGAVANLLIATRVLSFS